MTTCMDDGNGRAWCNPGRLHEVQAGVAVAVAPELTTDPDDCTCRRCQPEAQALTRQVRAVVARMFDEADDNPWDEGTELLLLLVHAKPSTVLDIRELARDYLRDMDECFCPCGGEPCGANALHIPACSAHRPGP